MMMGPMANENGNGAAADQQGPSLNTLVQYIKDLSFENPNAPRSLTQQHCLLYTSPSPRDS